VFARVLSLDDFEERLGLDSTVAPPMTQQPAADAASYWPVGGGCEREPVLLRLLAVHG